MNSRLVAATVRCTEATPRAPVKALALPELTTIARARPDVVVVCEFGALITEPLLSRFDMLNVHPSLLPRWRGAAPVERAIMASDDQTGVSIMRLVAGLDSGPVCLAGSEQIEPGDDYGSLSARLQVLGAELLLRTLDQRPPCLEQPEQGGAPGRDALQAGDIKQQPAGQLAGPERQQPGHLPALDMGELDEGQGDQRGDHAGQQK